MTVLVCQQKTRTKPTPKSPKRWLTKTKSALSNPQETQQPKPKPSQKPKSPPNQTPRTPNVAPKTTPPSRPEKTSTRTPGRLSGSADPPKNGDVQVFKTGKDVHVDSRMSFRQCRSPQEWRLPSLRDQGRCVCACA